MSSFINFKNFGDTSQPEPNVGRPMVANSPLTRQSSIYSLTFDELQNTLGGGGKDFGSMNMDELLKNIWSAEETQAMASTSNFGVDENVPNNGNNINNMQRQGSLTLPRTLSQKTVDEVWRELFKATSNGGEVKDGDLVGQSQTNLQPQQREPTLGEITLEDFLLKAGVVPENNQIQTTGTSYYNNVSQQNVENSSFIFGFQNQNQNHGFQQQVAQTNGPTVNQITEGKNVNLQPKLKPKPQSLFPKQAALDFTAPLTGQLASPIGKSEHLVKTNVVQASGIESGVVNIKTLGGIVAASPRNLIPKSNFDSTPSPPFYAFGEGGLRGKKSGTLEKVVDRRRRRMIKNRESAARSRARKQAYTLELEAEVAKLKELNHELLKKQEEIMEMQNNQVVEKMKLPWGSKRLCLRRTLTGPW